MEGIIGNKGYTIIELSTVMAIMAIMATFIAGGYLASRKSSFIEYAARQMQSSSREAFITSVTTEREPASIGDCNNRTTKIKVIEIPIGVEDFNEFNIVPYCGVDIAGTFTASRDNNVIDNVNLSDVISYSQGIETSLSYCVDGAGSPVAGTPNFDILNPCLTLGNGSIQTISAPNPNNLYLTYTSPYGEFRAFLDSNPNADSEGFIESWTESTGDRSFSPSAPPAGITTLTDSDSNQGVSFWIDLDVDGIQKRLLINSAGNVEIVQ